MDYPRRRTGPSLAQGNRLGSSRHRRVHDDAFRQSAPNGSPFSR